jgi:hypothetical protein
VQRDQSVSQMTEEVLLRQAKGLARRSGRAAAISVGLDPGGSECRALVDELLRAGYLQRYPSSSLTAHGLYRLTDSGIGAAEEAALEEARRGRRLNEGQER